MKVTTKALFIAIAAVAGMSVLFLTFKEPRGLPPMPARYPKAFCGPPITHVNVVFWHGWVPNAQYKPESFDGFAEDEEMERVAREVVRKFWNQPVSVIRTNDETNVLPKHLGQLVITFQRIGGGIGVEAQVYEDSDVREKIIKANELGESKFDRKGGARTLSLENNAADQKYIGLFIQSLGDIVQGKCNRVMSDHIYSHQKYWKFFPPYEHFNGQNGIGKAIAQ